MTNSNISSNSSSTVEDNIMEFYLKHYSHILRNRSLTEIIAESGLLLIIDFFSIFGNVALCWILYKSASLQTLTNLFILVLAISDILMGTLCIPFSIVVLIQGEWIFGVHVCRMQCYLIYALGFGSLQTLTLVAINRYYRILKPRRYSYLFTVKSTLGIVIVDWMCTAVLLAIPYMTKNVIPQFSPAKSACVMFRNPTSSKASILSINMAIVVISTIIPTTVITICYCRIFKLVGAHFNRIRPALASKDTVSQLKSNVLEIKSTRTLFLLLIAFAGCWLPVLIIELIQTFFIPWWKLPRSCHLIWTFCGCLRSAINPFIFASTSRSFRKRFWLVLKGSNSDSSEILYMRKRSQVLVRVSEGISKPGDDMVIVDMMQEYQQIK